MSRIVLFDNDDYEAYYCIYLFKSMQFEYSGMGGKPTGFKYEAIKDTIEWSGRKPKHYVPLLTNMFHSFVRNLPSK